GGGGGGVGLFSASGTIITRVPDPQELKGTQLDSTVPLAEKVRRSGRFDGRVMSEVLKEPVIVSVAAVRGFPLFVSVSKTERAALAAWREETRLTAERTLLTSVA